MVFPPVDQHADTPPDLHCPAIPARAERLAVVRRVVARWAAGIGVARELVEDVVLATYEAMANVVIHAYRGLPGPMDLHGTYDSAHLLTITVTDHGRWLPALVGAGPLRPGGRGLPLIQALTSDTTITSGRDGTTVRMTWVTSPDGV